jgi:chromosome segregation ATPase
MNWNLYDDGCRTERPPHRNSHFEKEGFLKQKVKESLETRLNYWKNQKIAHDSFEGHCGNEMIKHRKSKSHFSRKSVGLEDLTLDKLSTLDQVYKLIETALTIFQNFSNFKSLKEQKELKKLEKNLEISLNLLSEEQKNSHLFLKLVESLLVQHNSEIISLKSEYESKLSALEKQKQENSPSVNDSKVFESFKNKINSLEDLLAHSDQQVLEKISEINEKSSEIVNLKNFVSSLTNDLNQVKSDMKDVESFWLFQQETLQKQSQELFEEVKRLEKEKESLKKQHEKNRNELMSSVESYKSQFSKAYEALSRADKQIELLKQEFLVKEKSYKEENEDLASRVGTLEKSLDHLRSDLEIAQDRIEARNFIVNQCKQDELIQLQSMISRLKHENQVLHKHNKDLSTLTQKLEEKLIRLTTEKLENISRSDKTIKKPKK